MEVRRYTVELAEVWNAFNRQARNGHFMFDRGFMDYHADRFADASLMVFDGETPIALMAVNRDGTEAWSHQGLTFGGLVSCELGTATTLTVLDACADALKADGMNRLYYKALPPIYTQVLAQEDLYWLFRRDAALFRRDVSVAVDYRARGRVSSRRRRGAQKAAKAGVAFGQSHDWSAFWRLLEGVLVDRHAVRPVHSLEEIQLLAGRFPDEISLFTATAAGEVLAGVVMFRSSFVAHAQYIAVGEAGREVGALDGLFEHLIKLHSQGWRYFDFGISNTNQGRTLNEGLVRQKEEFGGSAVVHDFYRLTL